MFLFVFFRSLVCVRSTPVWSRPLHGQFYALQPGQHFGFDVGVNVARPGCANLNYIPAWLGSQAWRDPNIEPVQSVIFSSLFEDEWNACVIFILRLKRMFG